MIPDENSGDLCVRSMPCREHDKLLWRYVRAALEHKTAVRELKRNTCVGTSELLKQAVCETRVNGEFAYAALLAHERVHRCAESAAKSPRD